MNPITLQFQSLEWPEVWDDRMLLSQEPFLSTFSSWKLQLSQRKVTRSSEEFERWKSNLVYELENAKITPKLRQWTDLVFNSRPNREPKARVQIDENVSEFFISVQWDLYNGQVPDLLLKKKGRGLHVHIPTKSQQMPDLSTRRAEKRKAQAQAQKEPWKRSKRGPVAGDLDHPRDTFGKAQRHAAVPHKRAAVTIEASKSLIDGVRGSRQGETLRQSINAAKRPIQSLGQTKPKLKQSQTDPKEKEKSSQNIQGLQEERSKKTRRTMHKAKRPELMKDRKATPVQGSEARTSTQIVRVPTGSAGCSGIDSQQGSSPALILPIDTPAKAEHPETPVDTSPPHASFHPTTEHDVFSPNTNTIKNEDFGSVLPASKSVISLPKGVLNDCSPEEGQLQLNDSYHTWFPKPEPTRLTTPLDHSMPICKPPPPSYPPIWAQSRQEVCESFDWFRSYQGGVYHARNVARGYLLSAFSSKRDVFCHEGRLIISHGGGKAQSIHSHRGQHITQEADDQLAQDKSVRALLATYRCRRPIVLLIDDKYTSFPYDLSAKEITYAVLGFYTIVHAWAEYQPANNERGRVVRYKFAFQWCESQGEPWWLKFDSPARNLHMDHNIGEAFPVGTEQSLSGFKHNEQISTECSICHEMSPQVYLKAWACLNPECTRFWEDVYRQPLGDALDYNPQFLQLAPANSLAIPVDKLEPGLPLVGSQGITTDYACTRGWHCQGCGRLSSRYKWELWECMHCKAVLKVEGKIRSARDFLFLKAPVSFKDVFVAHDSGIEQSGLTAFVLRPEDDSRGFCRTYRLPNDRGFIHHVTAGNPLSNNEADSIFQKYQEQASTGALPFRRWPMRAHKCRGALLTNYFSQNAGVPYQYVGGTENTLPFDKVPDAVVMARDLIRTRVKQALGRDETFNEVLSAAYMERQRMAFHTDDEVGLGPLVAGLSLGSPALMHFRLLAKHTTEGVQRSIALTFVLRHGDILVMDGAGVQEFYEHTVVPTNFRIAATARYINPIHPKLERST